MCLIVYSSLLPLQSTPASRIRRSHGLLGSDVRYYVAFKPHENCHFGRNVHWYLNLLQSTFKPILRSASFLHHSLVCWCSGQSLLPSPGVSGILSRVVISFLSRWGRLSLRLSNSGDPHCWFWMTINVFRKFSML